MNRFEATIVFELADDDLTRLDIAIGALISTIDHGQTERSFSSENLTPELPQLKGDVVVRSARILDEP